MSDTPWFRRPRQELQRQQDRLLREWLTREVVPFSPFWADRLHGVLPTDAASLQVVPVAAEADIAGAGGPGNPALLLSPTEDQFKANAHRRELLAAARQLAGGGTTARRQAIWQRYKPIHIHEAGVDRLITVAYTRTDLDRLHLAGARLAEVMGWGAEDALVNLVPSSPSIRFWGLYHAALASRMTALHPRGAGQPPLAVARRALTLLPASVLAVPTAEAEALLDGLADARTPAPNLRLLVPVGPPPSADLRMRLAEVAERLVGRPVRVQAVWAPEISRVLYGEAPTAANDPAEATYGLVTYPDLERLEVRDPDTGAVVTDGPGELVVTSLGWRGTAMVRVATGSWVAGIESERPQPVTGATVPRIAPSIVDGAWQPRVRDAGRSRRIDLRGTGRPLAQAAAKAGIEDWSLVAVDRRLVLTVDAPGADQEVLAGVAERVVQFCGVRPEVVVGAVAVADRHRVGDAWGHVAVTRPVASGP